MVFSETFHEMKIGRLKSENSNESNRSGGKYYIHDNDADYNERVTLILAATAAPVCFHDFNLNNLF